MPLRALFTREHMIKRLQNAKPIPTVVMDEVFSHRPQLPSATVPVEDVSLTVRSMPLIQRGAASLAMSSPGLSITAYEPLSISINLSVSASDVNNLKQYDGQGLEIWAVAKTEILRRTIRNTTEGMAAQALSGKVEWPIHSSADIYTVKWGKPVQISPANKLDATGAGLVDVVKLLTAMSKELRRKGYGGGKTKVWAGEDAYNAILDLVGKYSDNQIKIDMREASIVIAGTEIILRSEEYPHPTKKDTFVPVLDKKTIRMIAPDGGHQMPYCALDDHDPKLAPLPLFIKPIKQDDPSGYKNETDNPLGEIVINSPKKRFNQSFWNKF